MNPLSVWTYYRRHRPRAALLFGASLLTTVGIYLMAALMWNLYVEPGRSNYRFLSKFSVVIPEHTPNGPDPSVVARLRTNPDIAQVIPATAIWITVPGLMQGEGNGFHLWGVGAEDIPTILEQCGATLKEGQWLDARTNGLLLSETVAASMGLHLGDTIHSSIDPDAYGSVAAPLKLVGILECDVRLGIVSLEFLQQHEQFKRSADHFLVVAREGHTAEIADFLHREIATRYTVVETTQTLNETLWSEYVQGLGLVVPGVVVVAIGFALVTVVVNWIALGQRLPELGISHAIGLSKRWLIRRLTVETSLLAVAGWLAGIALAWVILAILQFTFFAPRGHNPPIIQLSALALALPLPVAVSGFNFISVRRSISQLDPIAIIEQGQEAREGQPRRESTVSRSSPKPLTSATFYSRHRRRAAFLVGAMSCLIVAVVLTVFLLAASSTAQEPGLRYLSRLSIVRSAGVVESLDPGVAAQVRAHPAVERVIPVAPRYHLLSMHIPPFTEPEASPFGVYAEDMEYLVDLYGLELKEGRLPRPRSNEMVIPEALAQNRGLEIGEVIGNSETPAYPGEDLLPTEFVISGIFSRPSAPQEENWLGFVSLEYMESHEAYRVPDVPSLMVAPRVGQEDALNDWLEDEVAGAGVSVLTYRQQLKRVRDNARTLMMTLAAFESVIALVAALALGTLNYVFVSQRKPEFGLLHALGYGRRQLIARVMRETAFTTGLAWAISVAIGMAGLLGLRLGVFTPLGLSFDVFRLTPWLYTLPIPVAVLVIAAGATAWTLSRIDAVSIIERR